MRALCEAPDRATTARGVRDRALLHTLASSGMRASVTAALQVSISLSRQTPGMGIWVQDKNDLEKRLVLLSREAHRWIEEWRKTRHVPSDNVFTAYDGRGSSPPHGACDDRNRDLENRPALCRAGWPSPCQTP